MVVAHPLSPGPVDTTGSLTQADLVALVDTSRELAAEVNLRSLLGSILERATQLTGSGAGGVLLYDERKRKLYFAHATGPTAATVLENWGESSEKGVPIQGSKAGEVFATGRSLIVNQVESDATHFKGVDDDTRTQTDSMVCVPLAVGGKRIGAVQILNKRTGPYTDHDVEVLRHFADHAAVAVRNARLFAHLLAHMGLYTGEDEGAGPLEVADLLSAPAHSELLTVLFADMRGSTQLCHIVTRPEETQSLLNEFLAMLAGVVLENGGVVNKFLGDGAMALFRGGDHAVRAVRCAAGMVEGFNALRARWDDRINSPLGFLDLGVGITTDDVILGSIGSERVREFTAVGTAVNLAANLTGHARGGKRILVDKKTFRAAREIVAEYAGPEDFIHQKPGQAVGHPCEVYQIKSLHPAGAGAGEPAAPGPAPSPTAAPAEIFVSYSHRDRPWLDELLVHLKPYVRNSQFTVWVDTQIAGGELWRDSIEKALGRATSAVLLVSPNFLGSDFIAANELPPLLRAAAERGLQILWVPVSTSSFDQTEIRHFQAASDPSHPLDTLSPAERNRAWVDICRQVRLAR